MAKWPIVSWVRRAFARSTKQKPSGQLPSKGNANEILKAALRMMKQEVQGAKYTDSMRMRADLIDLIFPQVVRIEGDRVVVKPNVKHWAFACGQMLGTLAGLGLKADGIDAGIDEVCRVAKEHAHSVDKIAQRHVPLAPDATPVEASQSVKEKAIKDIEEQAANETDPAAKAALLAMAHNMRRELKGEKQEDAA